MKIKKYYQLILIIVIFGISNFSNAGEKLISYFSGSLNGQNKKLIQKLNIKDRKGYQIKLSFVNYSDSTTTLQYRLNSEINSQIILDGLNTKAEKISLNSITKNELQIEIEANINPNISEFITYDICILKKE